MSEKEAKCKYCQKLQPISRMWVLNQDDTKEEQEYVCTDDFIEALKEKKI